MSLLVTEVETPFGKEDLLEALFIFVKRPQLVSAQVNHAEFLYQRPSIKDLPGKITGPLGKDSAPNATRACHRIYLRKLVPKNINFQEKYEIVSFEQNTENGDFFLTICPISRNGASEGFIYGTNLEKLSFQIQFIGSENAPCCRLTMHLVYTEGTTGAPESLDFFQNRVFNKILKWCHLTANKEVLNYKTFIRHFHACYGSQDSVCIELSPLDAILNVTKDTGLISQTQLRRTYLYLKEKYAFDLRANWTESTDPNKFVFEEIGIGAYLITLWDAVHGPQAAKQQRFLDLGCGNGLLTYLLNSEGYSGRGIDMQKRSIWTYFREKGACLEQGTIVPSTDLVYSNVDWLIGNHSDELTPWIPYLSANSGAHVSFFILPCCMHDFFGLFEASSFKRTLESTFKTNAVKKFPQYFTYLLYLGSLSRQLGFLPVLEKLRIPSTKMLAIVGVAPKHIGATTQQELRLAFAKTHLVVERKTFQPRATKLAPKNCMTIAKDVKDLILHTTVQQLIDREKKNEKDVCCFYGWSRGGTIPLKELACLFDQSALQELKANCGGLQTLLKNHRQLFVIDRGLLRLRLPEIVSASKRTKLTDESKYKTKPCLFMMHHPNGCPLEAEACSFSHETIPF